MEEVTLFCFAHGLGEGEIVHAVELNEAFYLHVRPIEPLETVTAVGGRSGLLIGIRNIAMPGRERDDNEVVICGNRRLIVIGFRKHPLINEQAPFLNAVLGAEVGRYELPQPLVRKVQALALDVAQTVSIYRSVALIGLDGEYRGISVRGSRPAKERLERGTLLYDQHIALHIKVARNGCGGVSDIVITVFENASGIARFGIPIAVKVSGVSREEEAVVIVLAVFAVLVARTNRIDPVHRLARKVDSRLFVCSDHAGVKGDIDNGMVVITPRGHRIAGVGYGRIALFNDDSPACRKPRSRDLDLIA